MTHPLSTLLAEAAVDVEVPEPRPAQIVRRSRVRRLRRRAGRGAAVLTAAAVAATIAGVGLLTDGPAEPLTPAQQAAAAAAYDARGAFSVGSTVFIGDRSVDLGERVKSVLYTSEGVLVRAGSNPDPDEGPSRYTLVRPDGTTQRIDLPMGDRVAATDPDSPYVAYLEPGDGPRQWVFVAHDLRDGTSERADVTGTFTWGGWTAPPASTEGTRVWALFDEGWREWDWSTGEQRLVPGTRGAELESAHGRYLRDANRNGTAKHVMDFASGRGLLTNAGDMDTTWWLSPDGRYLRVGGFLMYREDGTLESPEPSAFLTVATGETVLLPQRVVWGWTPDGQALAVDPATDEVTVCDPATADCTTRTVEMGSGGVKLGGRSYGS